MARESKKARLERAAAVFELLKVIGPLADPPAPKPPRDGLIELAP